MTALGHLLVAGRYGWHRDELYYVNAGRHLAWGYVDQPPLTPVVARLAAAMPGGVWPLRVVAIAAQVGCVLLAAALARELGGRSRAQPIGAGCVAASPAFMGGSLLLGTTVLDQLAWAAVLVLVARALRTRSTAAWAAAGIAAGVGLENKHTVVVLLLAIFLGLLVTRRSELADRGPWIGGALALLVWAPNLIWDATNGWPTIDMTRVLADKEGGPLGSLAQLPLLIFGLAGLFLIVIWLTGVLWFLREPDAHPHRWLLVTVGFAVVAFVLTGGKAYYAAPALVALYAAGAVAIEAGTFTRVWRSPKTVATLVSASWIVSMLVVFPIWSPAATSSLGLNPETLETYGWPRFAQQVADAARALPPSAAVFTSNYGEAGALARFGPSRGLHLAVRSGHNAYGDWGPDLAGRPDVVLAVGEWNAAYLRRFWSDVTRVAAIRMPDGITNEETREHATIFVCRDPKGTWAQLWPRLRHLD